MSVPFRERNPVMIGAISLAVVAGLILAAFNAQNLPVIGGGDTYTAAFTEAGGLKTNDEVRVAGVRVGKVEKVDLVDGDKRIVLVDGAVVGLVRGVVTEHEVEVLGPDQRRR